MYSKLTYTLSLLFFSMAIFAQDGKIQIDKLDMANITKQLKTAPAWEDHVPKNTKPIVSLPSPDGTFRQFRVEEFSVFEPEMAARYPQIKSYIGQDIQEPTRKIRFNISPLGFYGVYLGGSQMGIVERAERTNENSPYLAYYTKPQDFECSVGSDNLHPGERENNGNAQRTNSCFQNGDMLRTFRFAVTVSHEYTTEYGGTLVGTNAAIADRLTVLNAVYENDLAMHFVLPANNDLIINNILSSTDATDPFSDLSDRDVTVGEGATHIASLLAVGEYDLGHTFHDVNAASVGGVAGYGVACRDTNFGGAPAKARGFSPWIIGTAQTLMFHEVGHQFACMHTNYGCGTNNKCSRYEPGRGSTIMSTSAGCSAADFYERRSDYFNVESIRAILDFVNNGNVVNSGDATCTPVFNGGGMCAAITPSGNTPPTSDANPNGRTYTIPAMTPFFLEGAGSDANGDALTYCWEQYDTDYTGSILPDAGGAGGTLTDPLFRSFPPTTNPLRMCPQLSSLLAGNVTTGTGEALPGEVRTMTWRLTVRDNYAGAGGIACDEISIAVDNTAGPFAVSSQNAPETWAADGSAMETVTWDVNGTNAAPVNCTNVDILFSQDGGQTFPFTLAANVPNDGSETFVIPSYPTAQGRVQVVCSDNIFFDLNDSNITITSSCSAEAALIEPGDAADAEVGDAALSLSLNPTYGTLVTNFTGDIQDTDNPSNLAFSFDNTFTTCSGPSNANYYDSYTFYVDATDTYNITFPVGDFPLVVNLYQNSFDPSSVCTNWMGSDSFDSDPADSSNPLSITGSPISMALSPGILYVLTISSFSGTTGVGTAYDVAISGAGGGQVYDNIPAPTPLADYGYTYVVVNDATGMVELVSATGPDLTALPGGCYSVHGLSYEIASLADPTVYQTMPLTTLQDDMAALTVCGDLSTNVVAVKARSCMAVNGECSLTIGN